MQFLRKPLHFSIFAQRIGQMKQERHTVLTCSWICKRSQAYFTRKGLQVLAYTEEATVTPGIILFTLYGDLARYWYRLWIIDVLLKSSGRLLTFSFCSYARCCTVHRCCKSFVGLKLVLKE